jgi:hypothetical protein
MPGAIETAQTWAEFDGCSPDEFEVGASFDGLTDIDGAETEVRRYRVGCGGPWVELWTAVGVGHAPPFLTDEMRDRIFAWLIAAGSSLQRDGFETGDGTVWDRSEPSIPPVPP